MTEPEQLEFDFSFDFSEDAVSYTASSYKHPPPRCPLWKRLLLMPFKALYHIGLFIVSVVALLVLLIMSLNRLDR